MLRSRSAEKTEENPDSPTPTSPPPEPTTSRLFAPIPSSPPPNSLSDPTPSQPLRPYGEVDWSTSESSGPSSGPAEPSDTPSTGDVKVSKAGLRSAIGSGFRTGCRLFASFVTTQEERDHAVWVPDDDDVQDVAKPAANIVYRRLPDEAKGGDLIDVVSLGLALVGYVAKNLQRRAEVRSLYALQAAAGPEETTGPTP